MIDPSSAQDPVWDLDRGSYEAICAYLGLTEPSDRLRAAAETYLAQAARDEPPPSGFQRFLAQRRVRGRGLGLMDAWTRLAAPRHPWRHRLNAVIALHECDARGYEDLRGHPLGPLATWLALAGIALRYALTLMAVPIWLGMQYAAYRLELVNGGQQPFAA